MKFHFHSNILIFCFCLLSFSLSAQTPIADAIRTPDHRARWPKCDTISDCTKSKLDNFISQNLVIPAEAKAQGAGGVVLVEFVVEKNGKIGEIKTLHDPGLGLGIAASNVIVAMKAKKIKWQPAVHKGKKVASRYMTPVSFNLAMPVKKVIPPVVEEVKLAVYDIAEVMPIYNGCQPALTDTVDCTFLKMINHIQTNMKYPDSALAVGAHGPVVVEFVIDTAGQVTNPVVTKGQGFGLDQEAVRIISSMPTWQPGQQDGEPVAVRMVVPILFQIPRTEKE